MVIPYRIQPCYEVYLVLLSSEIYQRGLEVKDDREEFRCLRSRALGVCSGL